MDSKETNTIIFDEKDFHKLLAEAQFRLTIQLPTDVEQYTYFVLMKFLKEKWSNEPIGLRLLELAQLAEKDITADDLQDLGDSALMVSSLEMKRLQKKGLREEYFLTYGAFAYEQAAIRDVGARSRLYFDLSIAFYAMVRVIRSVFTYSFQENIAEASEVLERAFSRQDTPLIIH